MPALFQRRCSLILAKPLPNSLKAPDPSTGILIEDLRVQFKVTKMRTALGTADIQVFNLAEKTRASLQSRGTRVILLAGYDKDMPQLPQVFCGDSRTIDHIRQGPDWVTKIQCGDGERNYKFARVNASFAPGTPIVKALKEAITALALDPGNSQDKLAQIAGQYVSGYAMQGAASAELTSILSGQGLEWSIQDGKIQILAPGEATKEGALLVNQQSGMLDSPEHGTPETLGGPGILKIKMLLQARATPGRQMRVESTNLEKPGYFVIQKVEHSGDTFGGEWFTQIEGRAQ